MGYTHYWERSGDIDKEKLRLAIDDMALAAAHMNHILAGPQGDGEAQMSLDPKGVYFNGIEDDSHETFGISVDWDGEFCFCKTAQKPYDVVVTACLCLLKHHLGDTVNVHSDGGPADWESGLRLAQSIRPDCKCPL